MKTLADELVKEIIEDSVHQTRLTVDSYVTEYVDSTSEDMRKEVQDLKNDLILKYTKRLSD